MQEVSQQRITWIDEFKGFVLLLVCLFHVEQSFAHINMGMEHLSAFRMSAFFFISGVLFSTRRFPDFKSYALHKTKVLLLPYVFLSLLFLALDPVLYHFEWFPRAPKMAIMYTYPTITNVWEYIGWNLVKIFGVGKSCIGSGPIWFVFTLYCISIAFFGIQKIAGNISHNSASIQKIIIAVFAIGSLTGGWLLFRNHIRLPLGIERSLTTLFFFACGWLCKDFIKVLGLCKSFILVFVAITSFLLYGFIDEATPWFSIMNNDLGKSLPKFLGSSFLGILGLVSAFQLLSRLPDIALFRTPKGILRNIARNGMIILAIHWWILLILRIVFKPELDKPYIAYLSILIVAIGVIAAIPLFRCKLNWLIAKEPVSVRESLSIR